MRSLELKNRRFNYLTVLNLASVNRNQGRYWECLCDCGNITVLSTDHLTRKKNLVKSCGCKQITSGKNHVQWLGYEGISKSWWLMHVEREYKNRRKKVSINIDMKYAWELFLKQDKKCLLSGVNLVISLKGTTNTASLDRIDSSKGYDPGNVQWVHKHVNFMKRDYDQNYFIDFCIKIVNNKKGVCGI